ATNIPYRDIRRRNFNNTNGTPARDRNRLTASPTRLAIKAPPIKTTMEIVEEDEEPKYLDSHEAFEALGYADESFNDST
ncbi:hypothetical protein KI387_016170, partial [Taxus chinensis]